MKEEESFILRRWRDGSKKNTASWRLSLKNIHTGEILYFHDTEALITHLETKTFRLQRKGSSQDNIQI